MDKHIKWFEEYVQSMRRKMRGDASLMDVKHDHSLKVLQSAQKIVSSIVPGVSPDLARTCLLAALYHDVGRFEQVLRWGTFKDSQSTNHGLLGVRVLKREKPLAGEPPASQAMIMAAVGMHNRFALPNGLAQDLAFVTNVVRDADKLDIIRIMCGYMLGKSRSNEGIVLNVRDEPKLFTPVILQDALAGRIASYADLQSVNDFKILLGTWLYGMNFACSKRIMKENGYLRDILQSLPAEEPSLAVRSRLLADLEAVNA